jgi:hypothetical protein
MPTLWYYPNTYLDGQVYNWGFDFNLQPLKRGTDIQ